MMHRIGTIAVAVALLLVAVNGVEANNSQQAAREAFKKGREAFKKGRYKEAALMLTKAHTLKPHPALLRYLGQTYLKLGDRKAAIDHFERYLRQAPQAPDREKVAAQIARLRLAPPPKPKSSPAGAAQAADTENQTAPAKTDLRPTGDDEEMPDLVARPKADANSGKARAFLRAAKWTMLVAGVGGLAAGVVFNAMASSAVGDLESEARANNPNLKAPTVVYQEKHFTLQQDYKRFNTMAIASYIAGGALVAIGATLFVLDRGGIKGSERRHASALGVSSISLAPMVGPGLYGMGSTVRF